MAQSIIKHFDQLGVIPSYEFGDAVVCEEALATLPNDRVWIAFFTNAACTGELFTALDGICYVIQFARREQMRVQIGFAVNRGQIYRRNRNWWSNAWTAWLPVVT